MKTKAVTIAAFVFIMSASLYRSTFFPESDIFWGARNGLDILNDGMHIFQPDQWNVITLGEEWSPNSWLWNVLLGVSFSLFGNYGFLLLTFVTNAAAYSFLWAYLQRLRIAPLTVLFTLIGCWVIMTVFMNGRSNTADFLILTSFLYLCHKLWRKLIPLLIMSCVLTVLWLNLHLTGVAAAALFPAIVYAMMHKEAVKNRWTHSILTLITVLVSFSLTPFGISGLVKVSQVENESKDLIIEWSDVFYVPEANAGIMLLLVLSLIAGFFIFKKKQYLYGLLTCALIYGTYDTIRLAPFLLVVVLAALIFWEGQTPVIHKRLKDTQTLVSSLMVIVTLIIAAASVVGLGRAVQDENNMFYVSVEELQLIPEGSRVALSQDAGSMAILHRPDVLVTLDGRNDLMGRDRYVESSSILFSEDLEALEAWLIKYQIDAVFVEDAMTAGKENIRVNMTELGWEEVKANNGASVYLKP